MASTRRCSVSYPIAQRTPRSTKSNRQSRVNYVLRFLLNASESWTPPTVDPLPTRTRSPLPATLPGLPRRQRPRPRRQFGPVRTSEPQRAPDPRQGEKTTASATEPPRQGCELPDDQRPGRWTRVRADRDPCLGRV